MLCKNCGKELPDESKFCPYCMVKFVDENKITPTQPKKKSGKKIVVAVVAAVCVVAIAVACALIIPKVVESSKEDGKTGVGEIADVGNEEAPRAPKSVENDDSLGLMNVKLRGEAENLNETQKLLVEYFDTDYFRAPYNSLQRFPQVYEGAQINFICYVTKIIQSNEKEYTALVEYEAFKTEDGYYQPTGNYAVIKGQQTETRIIEGDSLVLYGKYQNVNTYEVDGKSYIVPTVLVNRYVFFSYLDWSEPMFTMEEIRTVARHIFGDDVKIRYTKNDDSPGSDFDYEFFEGSYYTAELDNQSNANFTKYRFFAGLGGSIIDCKSEWPVERKITFSADFEHFYLQVFDHSLNIYTLECYDKELKKLWSREFDETTSAVIDYTADHIYLVANGNMYIIDAKTGEDAVEKKYVGAKSGIRKLKDGILLISPGKTDAVMKTDLTGNVLWTANLTAEISNPSTGADIPVVQIVDGNYVIQYDAGWSPEGNTLETYSVVITPDGKVEFDGKAF